MNTINKQQTMTSAVWSDTNWYGGRGHRVAGVGAGLPVSHVSHFPPLLLIWLPANALGSRWLTQGLRSLRALWKSPGEYQKSGFAWPSPGGFRFLGGREKGWSSRRKVSFTLALSFASPPNQNQNQTRRSTKGMKLREMWGSSQRLHFKKPFWISTLLENKFSFFKS